MRWQDVAVLWTYGLFFGRRLALAASSGPVWAQPRDYVYVEYGPYWYGGVYDHAALAIEDPGALDVVTNTPFQSGLWTVNPQPDGSQVYLTSVDSTNIVAIDTSTNLVDPALMISAGIVPVRLNDQRGGSRGVFFQPDGTLAYVVGEPQPDTWVIKVFSTSPPGQVGLITLPVGVSPQSLDFSPDGSLLFVSEFTNQADNFLMAFSTMPPFDLQGGIQAGRGFMAPPAFNHIGNKILVTSQDPPQIWVISVNSTGDLLTLDRVIALPDGAIPFNATFAPSGAFAYVTGGLPKGDPPIGLPEMIFKVDPNTGDVSAPIGGDDSVTFSCCQFSPDSMFAFATFSAAQIPIAFAEGMIKIATLSHTIAGTHSAEPAFPPAPVATNDFFGVSLINTDPNDPDHFRQVIGQLVNTGTARGIAISPGGGSVYVANSSGPVSKFQTGSLTPEAQIDLGTANAPRAIALTTDGDFAYVANFQSSSVSVIHTSDMTLAAGPISIGPFPVAIAAR